MCVCVLFFKSYRAENHHEIHRTESNSQRTDSKMKVNIETWTLFIERKEWVIFLVNITSFSLSRVCASRIRSTFDTKTSTIMDRLFGLFSLQSRGHTCVRQHVWRISFDGLNTVQIRKMPYKVFDLIIRFHVSGCQYKQAKNLINVHEYCGIELCKLNHGNRYSILVFFYHE